MPTLLLAVAKWLCQKRVSFSWSGRCVYSMRLNHQNLAASIFRRDRPGRSASGASQLVGGRIVDLLGIQQSVEGAGKAQRGVLVQLGFGGAEASSAQEVRDLGTCVVKGHLVVSVAVDTRCGAARYVSYAG